MELIIMIGEEYELAISRIGRIVGSMTRYT